MKKVEEPPILYFSDLDLSKEYTYADYLKWNFKERLELIKGTIFKMNPAPSTNHQLIATNLTSLLWSHFKGKVCKVFAAPFDVRLVLGKEEIAITTVVQPDITVVCDGSKLDERGCLGAPDLIVEILSPGNSKKEMRQKFELYEEAGVKVYWIIQPADKTLFSYVLNKEGKYIGLPPKIEDDILQSELFPNLAIDLKEVFEGL